MKRYASSGALMQRFSELSAKGTPTDGKTLTYALSQEPDCLDPQVSGLTVTASIGRNVIDSLVSQAPDGSFAPWLATSWKISPDLRTYTFALRKGVTFHDGRPVDAASVKANFDRIANPATKSRTAVTLLGPYAGTTVVDAATVQVRFASPYAPFLSAVSTTNLGLQSPASFSSKCDTLVGSGPFTLAGWQHGQAVTLRQNPKYGWAPKGAANQGPAHLSEVIYRFLPDETVRVGVLSSGQAQVAQSLTPTGAQTVAGNSALTLATASPSGTTYSLFLKTKNGPLADERVRTAVQRALDVDTIVAAATNKQYERAWSPISPSTVGYDTALD